LVTAFDDLSNLCQVFQAFDLFFHVDLVDPVAVQGLDYALCRSNRAKHEDFVVVVHVDVKAPPRIDPPIPLRLAFERAGPADLPLQLNYQMLEQVRDLGGLALSAEREAVVVVAVVSGEVREQLEKQSWDVRRVRRGVDIRIGHLDNQLDAIAVMEEDLNYSQLRKTPSAKSVSRLVRHPDPVGAGAATLILSRGMGHVKR